jgi:hypothetical protein
MCALCQLHCLCPHTLLHCLCAHDSGGLHQAIEAKEGVEVRPDSHATASITFQVFFRWDRQRQWGLQGQRTVHAYNDACLLFTVPRRQSNWDADRHAAHWVNKAKPSTAPHCWTGTPCYLLKPKPHHQQVLCQAGRHDRHGLTCCC